MTGGRSTHSSGQKLQEKNVQGMYFSVATICSYNNLAFLSGLYHAHDTLMAQLQNLNKSKPRNKVDENQSHVLNLLS